MPLTVTPFIPMPFLLSQLPRIRLTSSGEQLNPELFAQMFPSRPAIAAEDTCWLARSWKLVIVKRGSKRLNEN